MKQLIFAVLIFGLSRVSLAQTQANYAAQVNAGHPSMMLDFNDSTSSFREHISGLSFTPTGTITPRTAGFDTTNPNNYSATFAYNSSATAPNTTMGDFEWDQPFSVQLQINNLNMQRSGSNHDYTLVAKNSGASGYSIFLRWEPFGANNTLICVQESGAGTVVNVYRQWCTSHSSGWDVPNGYKYNIVITHAGTGDFDTDDNIYVNGTRPLQDQYQSSNQGNFGGGTVSVSGGTGYATTTAFTSTGGGPHCTFSGTMNATSGVPTSITMASGPHGPAAYGCTSTPTIILTSPTGTGAVLTPTVNLTTMSNSSRFLVNSGVSNEPTMVFDELAEYPTVIDQKLIGGSFVHTKFYQGIIFDKPADPPYVIYSNDGCSDMDNIFSLQIAIGAHIRGYIRLIAVSSDDAFGDQIGAVVYRQMLDAAGLHHIPVTGPSIAYGGDVVGCTAGLSTYNASTSTGFPDSVTTLRKALANLPVGKKAVFLFGGVDRILTDLMQSPADSISALSGSDLFAAKVAGAYFQGMGGEYPTFTGAGYNSSNDAASGSYVLAHNGDVPLNFFPGTPKEAGPGTLDTHTATDPLRILIANNGQQTRTCWDCLPTINFLTTLFQQSPTCGTMTMDASTGVVSGTNATDSHHCIYPMAPIADGDLYQGQVFTWFANSLINVSPQGFPRSN